MLKSRSSGYSLAEILVVMAIVGMISLVVAPNFFSLMQGQKVRASMQQLATDLRVTRQHAITRFQKSKLVFSTGGLGTRSYTIWDSSTDSTGTVTWTQFGPTKQLDPSVYFYAQTFGATSPATVLFQTSGGIDTSATQAAGGSVTPSITIRTQAKIPKNQYTFTFGAAGNFKTTASKW